MNHTLTHFADGTDVSVYDEAAQIGAQDGPEGGAVATGTVSGGSVTFSGLTAGKSYVAFDDDDDTSSVRFTVEASDGELDVGEEATQTVQAAIDAANPGDHIVIPVGTYSEEILIPHTLSGIVIEGDGGRGAVAIEADTDGVALTNHADDVTLINVGCAGDGTGGGIVNTGRRFRTQGCKIEGGALAMSLSLGTVAQIAAHSRGKGDDCWFIDTEFCWATTGVKLTGTDYGAVTQIRFRDCTFHDNTAADFEEATGSGGAVGVHFKDLDIGDCTFLRQEDGTEPTKYLSLNDDNGNKGVVHGCSFPTALAGGKNLVSTGLIWVGNRHTGGTSTGQPS